MADVKYNEGKLLFAKEDFTITDKLKVILLPYSDVAGALATHTFATASTNEIANGNGYTTGGQTIGTATITESPTGTMMLDAPNPVTWSASTITAGAALLYHDDVANTAIALFDFGSDQSSSSGDFTINWNVLGILTIS